MSQKRVSKTQNEYNPAGMAAYNQLVPQAAGVFGQYMNDPFKSTFFNQMLGMGQANIGQQNQTALGQITRNAQQFGGGGQNPYLQSLLAQQGRGASAQQANLFGNLLQNANQSRMWAAGAGAGFNPLQTGGTNTQTTSGLGTWLPQLVGAGVGAATGFMGGGASSLFKGFLGAGQGAAQAASAGSGAPAIGYGGTGLPGQNFPTPFFAR